MKSGDHGGPVFRPITNTGYDYTLTYTAIIEQLLQGEKNCTQKKNRKRHCETSWRKSNIEDDVRWVRHVESMLDKSNQNFSQKT